MSQYRCYFILFQPALLFSFLRHLGFPLVFVCFCFSPYLLFCNVYHQKATYYVKLWVLMNLRLSRDSTNFWKRFICVAGNGSEWQDAGQLTRRQKQTCILRCLAWSCKVQFNESHLAFYYKPSFAMSMWALVWLS